MTASVQCHTPDDQIFFRYGLGRNLKVLLQRPLIATPCLIPFCFSNEPLPIAPEQSYRFLAPQRDASGALNWLFRHDDIGQVGVKLWELSQCDPAAVPAPLVYRILPQLSPPITVQINGRDITILM